MKKSGRPKGIETKTNLEKSPDFGPVGNLIRRNRIYLRLSLSEVAEAVGCSLQFICNIEHGRAPLPWEKAERLAEILKVPLDQIQAANLSTREESKLISSMGVKLS